VQVGGDGLFQEIMNGLLDLRAQGGDMAAAAACMRLGHIPAGSTDAVAYSINGTRSQLTAALHIALGDRSADTIIESACLHTDMTSTVIKAGVLTALVSTAVSLQSINEWLDLKCSYLHVCCPLDNLHLCFACNCLKSKATQHNWRTTASMVAS